MPSVKQSLKRSISKSDNLKNKKNVQFVSTNKLDFEVAEHFADGFNRFRVGTCTGIYSWDGNSMSIVGVGNTEQGNGHLQDVFDWFEYSCKNIKKDLKVVEIMNKGFYKHLIEKRGFTSIDEENVIKYFK